MMPNLNTYLICKLNTCASNKGVLRILKNPYQNLKCTYLQDQQFHLEEFIL